VEHPRQFADITPAWLTSVLRDGGSVRAASVTGIAVEPIGVGVGFLGQLARLRLTYDRPEAGAPASVIGKFPTLDPGGRQICQMFRFYEREVLFYRELARHVPVRVPRCWGSVMDVAADDYLILLELVRTTGAGALLPDLVIGAGAPGVAVRRPAEADVGRAVFLLTRRTRTPAVAAVADALAAAATDQTRS